MRTGGCSIHQSLTTEAATIVKQAINLARRRGHAQVTPIHVATVMLASPAGLLRSACLHSVNSHPYQCKALELCFNVALNRLPATTPTTPLLNPHPSHYPYPSLANALMAAFKRAQAHQRRGSIDAQQQPILALKIEIDQLVISILDDPSVSRVMREAGFSSTLVKSNLQHSLSSLTTTTTNHTNLNTNNDVMIMSSTNNNIEQVALSPFDLSFSSNKRSEEEDVSSVMDEWVKRRDKSSVVVVGESLVSCEGVVRGIKDRVQRGDVPFELRYLQFLNCPLLSMKNLSREEIDMKLGEIKCLLKRCVGRGVVLYLGDLKWVAQYWEYYNYNNEEKRKCYYYCPVEHLVMGLRRLVFGNVENGRIWLMGISTFKSFIKCKSGSPCLETLLDLHALTIPSPTLDLTLNLDSNKSCDSRDKLENKIHIIQQTTNSSLPSWLLKCKEESRESSINNDHQEETLEMKELCKKWNLICSKNRAQKTSNYFQEKTIKFSSSSPSSSTSISSYDNYCQPLSTWPNNIFQPKWASKEHEFLTPKKHLFENEAKPDLLSNPNSIPNSASSSEATDPEPAAAVVLERFKENNLENLETLCCALEKKVPWQKNIIPEIVTTVMGCRSRKLKQETWLAFMGADEEGKLKIARELSKIVFGTDSFKSVSGFCSKNCKRARDGERLADAVRENPHRVFFVEDAENLDYEKGMKTAMETGKFLLSNGEILSLQDAIVIFSCDSFSSSSHRASSPPVKQKLDDDHEDSIHDVDDEAISSLPLDLNIALDHHHHHHMNQDSHVVLDAVDKQIFFSIQVL